MPTRGASEDDFESSEVRFLSSEPGDKFRQTSHHHCDRLRNYKGFLLYTFPRESNIKSVEYSVGKGPERPRLIIGDEKIFADATSLSAARMWASATFVIYVQSVSLVLFPI